MKQGKSNGWHPMSISPTACGQGTSNEKTASQNRRDYIPYEGWMLKIDFAHMFVTKHPTWKNNQYHIDIVLRYHMYIQKVILLKSWLYISFLSWSYISYDLCISCLKKKHGCCFFGSKPWVGRTCVGSLQQLARSKYCTCKDQIFFSEFSILLNIQSWY